MTPLKQFPTRPTYLFADDPELIKSITNHNDTSDTGGFDEFGVLVFKIESLSKSLGTSKMGEW